MNKVLEKDIKQFASSFPLKEDLAGKHFLITGGTGLIGSILTKCLVALNEDIKVTLPVRNTEKAKAIYNDMTNAIRIVEAKDLAEWIKNISEHFDYIIHCAAPTASKFFVEHPVETYRSIHNITAELLAYAHREQVKGFVYLSSLEVYGTITDDSEPVIEDIQGYIDPLNVRSSYPIAKRATECLCHLYAKQYGVNVKIARLTQTTGAGIAADDNRVIAQFARLGAQHKDIILHTTGESARPYCYTIDAISGILYILVKGNSGEAYNVANPNTYISARDMAYYVMNNFATDINVKMEIADTNCYAPPTKLKLSADKLKGLGWTPKYGLKEIFSNLIEDISSKS